ncbi:pyruvate kinase [Vineibacter terrae]|uniref:pyruvate kinase n=1 Tax=Vineibacter terrae TaxID=2586908 RepID=UPI002E313BA1|nr:pyruvate kinase [Vineibacter terrae]HEX2887375.1 pyruvate kinase [Vineibacter terrae]
MSDNTNAVEVMSEPGTLLDELVALREAVAAEAAAALADWQPEITRAAFTPSAANLAAYLALRRHDLGALQDELSFWGLSSLGRSEGRVLESLDAVIAAVAAIAGQPLPAGISRPDPRAWQHGENILRENKRLLFGADPHGPKTRVMVTLPTEAATDPGLVPALIAAGTDCFRINCAHDDPTIWSAMIRHVRAAAEGRRHYPVLMDIAGPKIRIDALFGEHMPRLAVNDRFALTGGSPPPADVGIPAVACQAPGVVEALVAGAQVWFDDGKLGAVVERCASWGVVLRITTARDKGVRLKRGKGLNFPDTDVTLPALTAKDLADLDFVAANADMVGFSFVQTADDVRWLQRELAARRGAAAPLPVVLKIETRRAVKNLPRLIVAAAGRQPLAVMIARGDLALHLGFKRLSEIQEEILWLCEAAHVPAIWATQVLEQLVRKGLPTRAETTDAAMGQRAECVMLNKGPHLVEGVSFLDDVLRRMDRHQRKKSARLAPLRAWTAMRPARR